MFDILIAVLIGVVIIWLAQTYFPQPLKTITIVVVSVILGVYLIEWLSALPMFGSHPWLR